MTIPTNTKNRPKPVIIVSGFVEKEVTPSSEEPSSTKITQLFSATACKFSSWCTFFFQYVGCYMQRCFLVITRNHECYHRFTLCLSIQSALLHIIRHAYNACHTGNPVKEALSDSTRHYIRSA